MTSDESLGEINFHSSSPYSNYVDSLKVEIPLFKIVKSKHYTVYLGIPLETSLSNIVENSRQHIDNLSDLQTDTLTYGYFRTKINNQHLSIATKKTDNSIVFAIAESQSKDIIDSLFNKNTFLNRFKHP